VFQTADFTSNYAMDHILILFAAKMLFANAMEIQIIPAQKVMPAYIILPVLLQENTRQFLALKHF
jgi:hypothetical protein